MDPHTSGTNSGNWSLVFDKLIYADGQGNLVADRSLAESWEVETDTRIVLKARQGVTFQDGTDFNAEAVKYNIERHNSGIVGAIHGAAYAMVQSVETPDDTTVVVNLSSPNASILDTFAERGAHITSPTHVEAHTLDELKTDPIGTGAFRLREWRPGGFTAFDKFDDHWRRVQDLAPFADEVVIQDIPDEVTQIATFQAGGIDVVRPAAQQVDVLEADDAEYEGMVYNGAGFLQWTVNQTLGAAANGDFRKALAYAMDSESMSKALYAGRYLTPASFLTPASWAYKEMENWPRFDMEKAREHLELSGLSQEERVIEIAATANSGVTVLEAVARSWEDLGVKVVIATQAEGDERPYKNRGQAGDLHTFGSAGTRADPNALISLYLRHKAASNLGGEPIGEIEELADKALLVYDYEERAAIYEEIARLHADTLIGYVPALYYNRWAYHRPGFSGTEFDQNGVAMWGGLHRTA